jgi:cytoskeletal protein RodZ
MGLFGKKADPEEEQELLDQLDDLQKSTEEVEAEKEAKRLAREEKRFHKEVEKKRKQKERFIAPLLLVITMLVSFVLWTVYR